MKSLCRGILKSSALALAVLAIGCGSGEEATNPSSANEGAANQEDLALLEDLRPESSEELVAALREGSLPRRQRAALAMGRIQSAAYAPALALAAAPDQPQELRRTALFALGQLGLAEGANPQKEAVDLLRSALQERDAEIVALATQALGKLAPEGAQEMLAPLLSHADAAVRREAAYGLFRTRFVPVWRRLETTPPELPEDSTQALIKALEDESPEVRRAAAHGFSRYGQKEAAEALDEALGDADEWTRLFAARGLNRGALATDETLEKLHKTVRDDPSQRVRSEAIAALGNLGAPARIPAAGARDESFHVRAAYAAAWSSAGPNPEVDKTLRDMLQDPSTTVRGAALTALTRRLGEKALPELQAAQEDRSWVLRAAAARALAQVGQGALQVAEKALQDEDLRVRTAALETLGQIVDTPKGTERIATALAVKDLAVRGTAVGLLAQRQHPQRIDWLEEAYLASPGVDWVEIREGIVNALAPTQDDGAAEETSIAKNAGPREKRENSLLRRIAAEDSAASVRGRARTVLTARGLTPPEAKPAGTQEASPFLGAASARMAQGNPTVVLKTSKGTLEILVLADRAPIHAASFLKLVEEGVYDGLIWHRVVPNFVIQGGDPQGSGWGGPGYALRDEISPGPFVRGSVGMPKAGKDTGGSQIFITHVPTPHLDGNYTIFGQVTEGLDVIDKIEVGDLILEAKIRP